MQCFRRLDYEEAIAKLPDHDTDKDGNITWPEFLSTVYGYKPEDLPDMEQNKNPDIQAFVKVIYQVHIMLCGVKYMSK